MAKSGVAGNSSGQYLDSIVALDPNFCQTYRYADTFIIYQPVGSPGPDEVRHARRLLEKGLEMCPSDGHSGSPPVNSWCSSARSFSPTSPEKAAFRAEGAKMLARAAELVSDNENVRWQAMAAAGVFTREGNRDAAISFLERAYHITDDHELKNNIAGKLASPPAKRRQSTDEAPRRKSSTRSGAKITLSFADGGAGARAAVRARLLVPGERGASGMRRKHGPTWAARRIAIAAQSTVLFRARVDHRASSSSSRPRLDMRPASARRAASFFAGGPRRARKKQRPCSSADGSAKVGARGKPRRGRGEACARGSAERNAPSRSSSSTARRSPRSTPDCEAARRWGVASRPALRGGPSASSQRRRSVRATSTAWIRPEGSRFARGSRVLRRPQRPHRSSRNATMTRQIATCAKRADLPCGKFLLRFLRIDAARTGQGTSRSACPRPEKSVVKLSDRSSALSRPRRG